MTNRYSLSCVCGDHAVWCEYFATAADMIRNIPHLDCGALYMLHDYRTRRTWICYHGSESRYCREVA